MEQRPIATFKATSANGKTSGTYSVFKRTFEAKNHPKGSKERTKLNSDNITSEYMPSHKYSIKGDNLSTSARTKDEAMNSAMKFAGLKP